MSRIEECFGALKGRNEAALVAFIMAGDPDLDTTREFLREAVRAGADIIELGVPFSDPTADGPVLQRSAVRALARGTSLPRILELVAEMREELPVPIILFGYYNPIFHYGPERFATDARRAGVDGVLVVDLPPDEADELQKPLRANGIDQIFLLAPTSDASRIKKVVEKASGFVYFVSMTGITGSKAITPVDVRPQIESLRTQCKLPIGVGFGIRSAAEAHAVAAFADAVIVGTAIMQIVEDHHEAHDIIARLGEFLRQLKAATMRSGS